MLPHPTPKHEHVFGTPKYGQKFRWVHLGRIHLVKQHLIAGVNPLVASSSPSPSPSSTLELFLQKDSACLYGATHTRQNMKEEGRLRALAKPRKEKKKKQNSKPEDFNILFSCLR